MINEILAQACARPRVVGSFGNLTDLHKASQSKVHASCNLAEIRLDYLCAVVEGVARVDCSAWSHLGGGPLLFTARRADEGGHGNFSAVQRMEMLEHTLNDAACVDVEVASIAEMSQTLQTLLERDIPWIASFHDFEKLPSDDVMKAAAARAKDSGAAIFKIAAMLHSMADMARLAEFQLEDHGLAVATMGMGALAPVSRLLCAQCGSVLNYGYLGATPTAPGQWDAAFLKQAIERLAPYPITSTGASGSALRNDFP